MKIFDNNICHITFTHSDCSDIWPLYFTQMKKYFSVDIEHFVCTESYKNNLPSGKKSLIYNEALTYPERLLSCLEQIPEYEFIFFDHEDMFLYAEPNFSELQLYYGLMKNHQLEYIRLIKGGDYKSNVSSSTDSLQNLELKSKWIFSIQPSFWKVSVLKEILLANLNCNIWELEVKSQKVVKKMKIKAAFSHKSGTRRGLHHFDNNVYPYIATAIGKGKWNLSEYSKELGQILSEHNINPDSRGWF
jgi:hypothetical protein